MTLHRRIRTIFLAGEKSCQSFVRTSTVLLCIASLIQPADAGSITLKNGFTIQGAPFAAQALTLKAAQQSTSLSNPIWGVDTGMKRYFVPKFHVAPDGVNKDAELSRFETFKLPQKKSGRKLTPTSIGGFKATAFNKSGHRTVTLKTQHGEQSIVQGITKLTPNYLWVEGITHAWEHGVAPTSLPGTTLDAILKLSINSADSTDRQAVCRFYIQAEMFDAAARELDSMIRDFPQLKDKLEKTRIELRQLKAQQLLREIKRRRTAGQYALARKAAQRFPLDKLGAKVGREVRQLLEEFESGQNDQETTHAVLGELQAALKDEDHMTRVGVIRGEIRKQLNFKNLPRLRSFLNLKNDATLSAESKIALAVSGWIAGSTNATTDLDEALNAWDARFLVLEYLRASDESARAEIVEAIEKLEGVGIDRVQQLIPMLPPLMETPGVSPSNPATIEVGKHEGRRIAYTVQLPTEYSPDQLYPMIVTLRPAGRTPESQINWWAGTPETPGQAQRHGYIVIAPHYFEEGKQKYDFRSASHHVVLESIRDARKRFTIDADRVFLSGHGAGGDAAFDIGTSHPDYFAGVIPIVGMIGEIGKWYWQNGSNVPWYIVAGQLDRNSLDNNGLIVNRMMRYHQDVIYAEYIGRGYEPYYEEIHRLFEWMSLHKRKNWPSEIDMRVLRPADRNFYWLSADQMPRPRGLPPRPIKLIARASKGNTITLTSPARTHTLWLSSDLVDFEKKVKVRHANRRKFDDFVRPAIGDLLEWVRLTGDRKRLCQARIKIK